MTPIIGGGGRAVTIALLLVMMAAAPYRANAITCSQVFSKLYSCLTYIEASGGPVPTACCNGLRSLVAGLTNKSARQTTCSCLESGAAGATQGEWAVAASIPTKCGVKVPYKISRSTDCSQVN